MVGAGRAPGPGSEDKAARLKGVVARIHLLQLEAAGLAADLEEDGYGRAQGYENTLEWLRHECRLRYGAASDLLAVGGAADKLNASVVALVEGEIGFGHLVLMSRVKAAIGEVALDEERLLAEAREMTVNRFVYVCEQARHAAEPEQVLREHADQVEQRRLTIHKREDGMVTVGAIFDAVGGQVIESVLRPLAKKLGAGDHRRKDRRFADALVELATTRTTVHVHATATLGALLHVPHSAPGDYDGTLLPQATLQRMTCDCSVGRMLFEGDSVLIDVGRERRVVSPSQRRALEVSDRTCRWPGCTRPGRLCEAHHLIPWTRGGATNLDNLALICWTHHAMVHEGRWQLIKNRDGQLSLLRPPLDFTALPRGPSPPGTRRRFAA
jgi:hypothetical protein